MTIAFNIKLNNQKKWNKWDVMNKNMFKPICMFPPFHKLCTFRKPSQKIWFILDTLCIDC